MGIFEIQVRSCVSFSFCSSISNPFLAELTYIGKLESPQAAMFGVMGVPLTDIVTKECRGFRMQARFLAFVPTSIDDIQHEVDPGLPVQSTISWGNEYWIPSRPTYDFTTQKRRSEQNNKLTASKTDLSATMVELSKKVPNVMKPGWCKMMIVTLCGFTTILLIPKRDEKRRLIITVCEPWSFKFMSSPTMQEGWAWCITTEPLYLPTRRKCVIEIMMMSSDLHKYHQTLGNLGPY